VPATDIQPSLPPLPPDVERRIRNVMAEVLGVDAEAIGDDFGRDSSPRWDSLRHLRMISSLEQALGLRFTMAEVRAMERFAEIRCAVAARLART
jgi:acyl carrier protein